MTKRTAVKL